MQPCHTVVNTGPLKAGDERKNNRRKDETYEKKQQHTLVQAAKQTQRLQKNYIHVVRRNR